MKVRGGLGIQRVSVEEEGAIREDNHGMERPQVHSVCLKLSKNNTHGHTGEMALWVKCLHLRHEDLSSVPWTPHKARYNIAHLQGVEAEHLHLEGGRMEAREPASLKHSIASKKTCCLQGDGRLLPSDCHTSPMVHWHLHHHPTQSIF